MSKQIENFSQYKFTVHAGCGQTVSSSSRSLSLEKRQFDLEDCLFVCLQANKTFAVLTLEACLSLLEFK
jgi:hypothetical protein